MKRKCISSTIVLVFSLVFNACCEGSQNVSVQIYDIQADPSFNTEILNLPNALLPHGCENKLFSRALLEVKEEGDSILSLYENNNKSVQMKISLSDQQKKGLESGLLKHGTGGKLLSLSGKNVNFINISLTVSGYDCMLDTQRKKDQNIVLPAAKKTDVAPLSDKRIPSIDIILPIFMAGGMIFLIFLVLIGKQ